MKLESIFTKLDEVANLPETVSRIRRLIFELAVQGKLATQDPDDEPAALLLNDIRAERTRLAGLGKIKKHEILPEVNESAIKFSLPPGWAATQLGDVAVCLDYMREPINGKERELRIAGKAQDQLFPYFGATQQQGWIDGYIFDEELVLLGEDGVPFFDPFRSKAYLISGKTWVNNHAHVFRGLLVSNSYLMHWLNVFDYTGRVAGSTRSKLNQAKAVDIPIALPPLAEQKRIVAKVDELMAICDRLEAQLKERETREAELARAALARFTADPTPENLKYIFHESFQISPADIRKTIISVAIQGKLVDQVHIDKPAETITKQIRAQRADDVETSPRNRDLPWPVSNFWKWVRLREIVNIKHGFAFGSEDFTSEPTQFVLTTPGNFYESGGFRDRGVNTKYYKGEVPNSFILNSGDLIIPMTEQAAGLLGSPAFIPDDGKSYLHNQRLGKLEFYSDEVLPSYVFWFFNSEYFRNELAQTCTGMKVRHTSPKRILNVLFALPPFAEQCRIVAKVNELMAIVDDLESKLAASRETAKKLLDAMVHELTNPKAE